MFIAHRWRPVLSLSLAVVALLGPRAASADYTGYAAPRIAQEVTGPESFVRALSLCVESDRILPVQPALQLEKAQFQGTLVIELAPGAQAPQNLRLAVSDVGSAQIMEQTPTRLVLSGFSFDFNVVFDGTAVRVDSVGDATHVATFCDPAGVCTQSRTRIVFLEDTSTIQTQVCDAPPNLLTADDDGVRDDDDYTSAQPLRFAVSSAEPSVTLLRDGVPIQTQNVVAGTATLQDASSPGFALHAYQVRHGARSPSAARFVERHPPPGAPVALAVLSGDQAVPVQQAFPGALIARVTDANGLGVPNVDAVLTVVPGVAGATATFPQGASSYTGRTDGLGQFTAPTLTAGTMTGTFAVRLSLAGVPDAQAPMRVQPGPVASIVVVSGRLQQAEVGEEFEVPLRVRVRDAFGNRAEGASITFGAPASAPTAWILPGSSPGATRSADANGEAAVQARAVFAPGAYQLVAASNGETAVFALENLAQGPTGIAATTATALIDQLPGSSVTPPPTVRVLDQQQQPMPGIRVTFSQVAGGAVLTGTQPLTDANGMASLGGWQLGAQDTLSRLEAKVFGLPPVEFSARTRAQVDVGVAVDNGRATLLAGDSATWIVEVTNAGPATARDTALLLETAGIAVTQWRCIAQLPSVCDATAGVVLGTIEFDIAPQDLLRVEIDAAVTAPEGGEAGVGAGLVMPSGTLDANATNDTASDLDPVAPASPVVFADGFESSD